MSNSSVVVVGAGLIGLATARAICRAYPGMAVTVLEKEVAPASHQSGRNSGVLHAGLGYMPGSRKARLAPAGLRQLVAFCDLHGVAYDICGKLVVATEQAELVRLEELLRRGRLNGLRGLEWLGPEAMREVEPHVVGIAALRVPEEGIADFPGVARALVRELERLGAAVLTGAEVTALRRRRSRWLVSSHRGELECDLLVNCAGLHSDRIARLAGERVLLRIVPFRGEYYRLRPDRAHLVRHLIYPGPHLGYPLLGVHLTRRIDGGVLAGPNAVLAFAREGYRWSTVVPKDLVESVMFGGVWRFAVRHRSMVLAEARSSLSRGHFVRSLRRLVPEIAPRDLESGPAGVRAQAMHPDGRLADDFQVMVRPGVLHVLNAPSPGATACLAIADELVAMLADQVGEPARQSRVAQTD